MGIIVNIWRFFIRSSKLKKLWFDKLSQFKMELIFFILDPQKCMFKCLQIPETINMEICQFCGASFSTYHGLRIHQGKMGCTPKGMRIPQQDREMYFSTPATYSEFHTTDYLASTSNIHAHFISLKWCMETLTQSLKQTSGRGSEWASHRKLRSGKNLTKRKAHQLSVLQLQPERR